VYVPSREGDNGRGESESVTANPPFTEVDMCFECGFKSGIIRLIQQLLDRAELRLNRVQVDVAASDGCGPYVLKSTVYAGEYSRCSTTLAMDVLVGDRVELELIPELLQEAGRLFVLSWICCVLCIGTEIQLICRRVGANREEPSAQLGVVRRERVVDVVVCGREGFTNFVSSRTRDSRVFGE